MVIPSIIKLFEISINHHQMIIKKISKSSSKISHQNMMIDDDF